MTPVLPRRSQYYQPGDAGYSVSLLADYADEKLRVERAFVSLETLSGGGGRSGGVYVRTNTYPDTVLEDAGYVPVTLPNAASITPLTPGLFNNRAGYTFDFWEGHYWVCGGNFPSSSNVVWFSVPDAQGRPTTWAQYGIAPWSARSYHVSLVHNNKLYVIGGGSGLLTGLGNRADVWSLSNPFLPGAVWVQEAADGGFSPGGGGRGAMSNIVQFDGKYWFVGGWRGTAGITSAVYSATDPAAWTLVTTAQFPSRLIPVLLVRGSELWLAFGTSYSPWFLAAGFGGVTDIWKSSNGMNWTQVVSQASNIVAMSSRSAFLEEQGAIITMGALAGLPTDAVASSENGLLWSLQAGSYAYLLGRTQNLLRHNGRIFGLANNDVYEVSFSQAPVRTSEGQYLYRLPA